MTCLASGRKGSEMQSTAASVPPTARYRWVYWLGRRSNLDCSSGGMRHSSSSNTKWALPMITRSSPQYWQCHGPPSNPPSSAFLHGKGPGLGRPGPRHWPWSGEVLLQASSQTEHIGLIVPPKGMTATTVGQARVKVPVLSKTMVSAFAIASKYFPPFTVTWFPLASRIAEGQPVALPVSKRKRSRPSARKVPW